MEYLHVVGIVHALFTAAFLATKRGKTLSDSVLAGWMVFLALPLLSVSAEINFQNLNLPVLHWNLIYPLTYGPFLWLYVGTLTGDIARLGRAQWLHFVPFALVSLFQILTGWAPALPNPEADTFGTAVRSIGTANLLLLLAYTAAVLWRLRRHDQEVVEHFSELPGRITLAWLRWMTLGVCGVFLLLFLASALSLPAMLPLHLIALIGFILGMSFFGLRQTQVFERQPDAQDAPDETAPPLAAREALPQPALRPAPQPAPDIPAVTEPAAPSPGDNDKTRYRRSGLTEARAEVIAQRLDAYMQAEQPYLDAELTIEKLAKRMAVPRHHLTQVISEKLGKNFYLFVNEYRIETTKRALRDPEGQTTTLLEIAYDSGFNSKSTFNTAFKRLTGMTPSQYRDQQT